jgi:site-specific recombinase XerD
MSQPRSNYALPPALKADAREAAAIAATSGLSILELVKLGLEAVRAPVNPTKVSDAITPFMRSRLSGLRPSTYAWYDNKLRFLDGLLAREMDAVTRDDLVNAANSMAVKEPTRCSYYRAARALWRWAMAQQPPMASKDVTFGLQVTPKRGDKQNDKPLAVADVERIMHNLPAKFRPAAALLFFAGIRPQEMAGNGKPPMLWACVNVDDRLVTVPAQVSKTRRNRHLEELPDALWRFIGRPGKDDAPICPAQSQWLIRAMQLAGGFATKGKGRNGALNRKRDWPHDATRHAFASYALALTADPGKVSMWLGHQGNPKMLYNHYFGLCRKADAEKYFAIKPA